jgi:hypothetical protein
MVKVGEVFKNKLGYSLQVIEVFNARKVLIRFDATGYETYTQSSKITEGAVKDVMAPELYGIGYYGSKQRSLSNPRGAYNVWKNMLYRCYAPEAKITHPTYQDCSVCIDWHNFTNFYHWYMDNHIDNFHLDKDIKYPGNKIYSPETCMFVHSNENQLESHAKTFIVTHPCGKTEVVSPLSDFCKNHGLSQANMSAVINGRRKHHKGFKVELMDMNLISVR